MFDNNISVSVIQKAIKKAAFDNFVISNGYSFEIILSGNVINRLINGTTNNQIKNNQQRPEQYTDEEYLKDCDDLSNTSY